MPTLEKQISGEYRRFGRLRGHREYYRIEATTREHVSVCERGRTLPREWFVPKSPLPNRAEWRGVLYQWKAISGSWTKSRSPQKKRTLQARTGIPQNIARAITSSRGILDLSDDWDEQGSPGYEQATWQRACDFLVQQAKFARGTIRCNLPAPRILPGPDGSIDVHWKMRRFELLVNIPKDQSKPATFYGDDFGNSAIRGILNPAEAIPGLVAWLLT